MLTPLVVVKAPNAADLGGGIMARLKEGVRPEPTQPPARQRWMGGGHEGTRWHRSLGRHLGRDVERYPPELTRPPPASWVAQPCSSETLTARWSAGVTTCSNQLTDWREPVSSLQGNEGKLGVVAEATEVRAGVP